MHQSTKSKNKQKPLRELKLEGQFAFKPFMTSLLYMHSVLSHCQIFSFLRSFCRCYTIPTLTPVYKYKCTHNRLGSIDKGECGLFSF